VIRGDRFVKEGWSDWTPIRRPRDIAPLPRSIQVVVEESAYNADAACVQIFSENSMSVRIPAQGREEEGKRIAALCHELGHVVSEICNMPGILQDPRRQRDPLAMAPSRVDNIVKSEEEAWENAEKIFHAFKKRALDSYKMQTPINEMPWFNPTPGKEDVDKIIQDWSIKNLENLKNL